MDTTRRPGSIVRILAGIVLVAFAIYIAIGARAANGWAHPRRDSYLLATSASFNLEYQDVRFPSRDKEIEISGWWIPRAGSTKAIVMVHGRGENRTTEFYSHFLDLAAALNTFQGRGFNVLMIDLRAHGLSGGAESAWGINERHNVEAAVDWIKTRGFQAASIGALGGVARRHGLRLRHGRRSRHPRAWSPMAQASTSTPVSSAAGRDHPERRSFSFRRRASWSAFSTATTCASSAPSTP